MSSECVPETRAPSASYLAVVTWLFVAVILGSLLLFGAYFVTWGVILLPVFGAMILAPFVLVHWVLWGRKACPVGTDMATLRAKNV